MGKKKADGEKVETVQEEKPEVTVEEAGLEPAVEPEKKREPEPEPEVKEIPPRTALEPRISLREIEGLYGKDTKVMARIKALKVVMGADWASTNRTAKQWLWFCRIVGLAPVNKMALADWIKLVTDGGTKEQKTLYADILKQLEV